MEIIIHKAEKATIHQARDGGSSFEVKSKLVLHAEDNKITHTIMDVPPYTKKYGIQEVDFSTYIANPDKVIFFAYVNEEFAGQILVFKYWNGYAYIEDIAVEEKQRGQGIGRALVEHAIQWANSKGFPGVMFETQNNNVAACHLYECCGFELCGFDTHLYKAIDPSTNEIALYWYLIF